MRSICFFPFMNLGQRPGWLASREERVQNGVVMEHERKASDFLYAERVFRATERAMGRAASIVDEDLKGGLNTLATIASIAPFGPRLLLPDCIQWAGGV